MTQMPNDYVAGETPVAGLGLLPWYLRTTEMQDTLDSSNSTALNVTTAGRRRLLWGGAIGQIAQGNPPKWNPPKVNLPAPVKKLVDVSKSTGGNIAGFVHDPHSTTVSEANKWKVRLQALMTCSRKGAWVKNMRLLACM